MKLRFLRSLAVVLMLQAAVLVKADYTSLTVKENSGTWTSFGLNGLKVTFGTDKITVACKEFTQAFAVTDVYSMLLTDLPTAIEENAKIHTVVSLQGSTVRLNVKAGTLARVYDAKGNLYCTARIGQEGTPVFIGNLEPGIYIVKAGSERCKVLVK